MKTSRLLDRRLGFSLASLGMLLGIASPAVIPAFASAGTLTTRKIEMSSSAQGATGVSYKLTFTPETSVGATGGIYVDFCTDSPLISSSCTAPSGMTTAGLSADTGTVTSAAANSIKLVTALTATTPFTVTFSGITNPDNTVTTFYARVMTYADTAAFAGHTSTTVQGSYTDNGSIALSATSEVGVTAYVLESMTFCVSKGDVGDSGNATAISTTAAPSQNCGANESSCSGTVNPGCVVAPSMTLGEQTGSVIALDSTHLSTGQVYAQLSTNASGGAIVNLKSDAANCGGLYRNNLHDAAHCNIGPQNTATTGDVAIGSALFGLKVGSPSAAPLPNAGGAGSSTGTFEAASGGNYNATKYYIDADNTNATGVTSTYGSQLLDTNGTQTSNVNIPITFGASISPTTPAGVYGANFSMIATGTF